MQPVTYLMRLPVTLARFIAFVKRENIVTVNLHYPCRRRSRCILRASDVRAFNVVSLHGSTQRDAARSRAHVAIRPSAIGCDRGVPQALVRNCGVAPRLNGLSVVLTPSTRMLIVSRR